MATKRSSSNDEGDLRQGEEDTRSVPSEAKLPRLHSSDGGKGAEIVATDQEPRKDQEPQAAVAGKRSNCGSIKEQGEEDTDSRVSEAKKRKVANESEGAAAEEAIQGVQPEMQKLCYKGEHRGKLRCAGVPRPLLDNVTLRDSGLSANAKILVVGCTVADLYTIMTPAPEDLKEKPPAVKKEPLCKQAVHKNIIDDGVPEDAIPGILNVNGLRIGPAENLSIWIYIYWVPAQYVQAIKDAILG